MLESRTYQKSRARWNHKADKWTFCVRVVGCGIDCDADASGYFINSDGSKTLTSDEDAALILLFSRVLAARRNKLSVFNKLRCWFAKILLSV